MSHPTSAAPQHGHHAPAPAPIRWPRPAAATVLLLLLWVVGLVVGILGPALVVTPGAATVPTSMAMGALGLNVLGFAIMVVAGVLLFRRHREGGLMVFTIVPSGAVLMSGLVMLGTKMQFS